MVTLNQSKNRNNAEHLITIENTFQSITDFYYVVQLLSRSYYLKKYYKN